MKKIIIRLFVLSSILVIISITYLSTVGIETDRLNKRISKVFKKLDKNLDIELNKVSVILNPLTFSLKAKTIGANLNYRGKILQLEQIGADISLLSVIKKEKFILTGLNASTKSVNLKNSISIIRLFKNDPKLFVLEQFIKNGYLIANIKFKFDEKGKFGNNYKLDGIIKNGTLRFSDKYELDKIDLKFNFKQNLYQFEDLKFLFNGKKIYSNEITAQKQNNKFSVSGKIENKDTIINKKEINDLIISKNFGLEINEINFNSKNNFNFQLDKNFKINNLNYNSDIVLNDLKIKNSFKIKKFFPKIKKELILRDHKIKLNYKKNDLKISGSGKMMLQNAPDKIEYKLTKNKDVNNYNAKVIFKNQINLQFLNYEKDKNSDLEINIKAQSKNNKKIFEEILLKEKNNSISVKNLSLSSKNQIEDFLSLKVDFLDKNNFKNKIQVIKNRKGYLVSGESFNIDRIIETLLNSDDKNKLSIFKRDLRFNFDVKKIYLDKENIIKDLKGYLFLQKNKISELNLVSKFTNEKKITFTIKNNGEKQITTIFTDKAKPLVDRYKFIKGFSEGSLDFYSVENNDESNSTLRIYDFKLKELPVLTKILTLASLQGIADLLSGEGIRFNEFEMKFANKGEMMNIEEIYAIGPAISILMNGYIKKNKLISLRGTLVPATTINKSIGSIPILGEILVGKKIGEGVFGVSFKIKGPPKNLETSVNPIKTLTPRFITRTLEKIKKN